MVRVTHCRWRSTVAAIVVAVSGATSPAFAVDDGSYAFGSGRQSPPAQNGYQQTYNFDSNSYYRQQSDYNRQPAYGSQQYNYGQQQYGYGSQQSGSGERSDGGRVRSTDTSGEETPRRRHRRHRHAYDWSEGEAGPWMRRSRRVSTTLKGAGGGSGAYAPTGGSWGAYGQNAVCVRTCDGYFFPMGPVGSQTSLDAQKSLCTALCPDAKTELYFLPQGADGIATAVTEDGRPYSKMPNALRYTKSRNAACTCNAKEPQSRLVALMKDITIRRGDAVMTTNGVLVFNGAYTWPYRLANFQMLDKAKYYLSNALALAALEQAAMRVQQTVKGKDRKDKPGPAGIPATFITDNSGKTVRLIGEALSYAPQGQPPQEMPQEGMPQDLPPTETAQSQERAPLRATR